MTVVTGLSCDVEDSMRLSSREGQTRKGDQCELLCAVAGLHLRRMVVLLNWHPISRLTFSFSACHAMDAAHCAELTTVVCYFCSVPAVIWRTFSLRRVIEDTSIV